MEGGSTGLLPIPRLLSERFSEVSSLSFYRDLFPVGSLEEKGVYETGRYNGVIIELDGRRALRHTLTDDLDKAYEVTSRDNFCLLSPISYIGKSRRSENARELFALAIDLDGIDTEEGFNFFMAQIENGHEMLAFVWGLPKPTYIVASGTGMHLYYVLEKPVRLFPDTVKELERLKKRLTWQAWTQGASSLVEHVQYESLFQGFRMVGTVTKVGTRAKAFRVGEKVTIDYLNKYVPEESRAQISSYTSTLTLEEARVKYPDWYKRRIVDGAPKGTWTCKRDLYNWWIRKLKVGAEQGHRYWCVMTLAVYAKKCGIDYDEVLADAMSLIDFLNLRGDGTDPFTEADVMDALEAYNASYMTYPIDAIVERTGIPIKKNKRNGRKREQHIAMVNATRKMRRDVFNEDEYRNSGRPKGSVKVKTSKGEQIRAYAAVNPEANHSEIARALGVSRPTVIKWLKD